jgi:hypothetical protein
MAAGRNVVVRKRNARTDPYDSQMVNVILTPVFATLTPT